jgi:hypothetical protein
LAAAARARTVIEDGSHGAHGGRRGTKDIDGGFGRGGWRERAKTDVLCASEFPPVAKKFYGRESVRLKPLAFEAGSSLLLKERDTSSSFSFLARAPVLINGC